jgi:hypothetical protein
MLFFFTFDLYIFTNFLKIDAFFANKRTFSFALMRQRYLTQEKNLIYKFSDLKQKRLRNRKQIILNEIKLRYLRYFNATQNNRYFIETCIFDI